MKGKPLYVRVYRFLQQNWTSIAAVTSVIGFLISDLIEPLKNYKQAFIFVGANAVIWTLIELRMHLLTNRRSQRYTNMRAARPDITSSILSSLFKKKETTIIIVGGRIRTISDILREIAEAIHQGDIKARNTSIQVFCLDPEYVLSSLSGEILKDRQAFEGRFSGYKHLVSEICSELRTFYARPEFQQNNVKIDIYMYREFPCFYGYLIEDIGLYWGHFTWNQNTEDFEGPLNPCYFIDPSSETYEDFCSWFKNRTEFYRLTALTGASICRDDSQRSPGTREVI